MGDEEEGHLDSYHSGLSLYKEAWPSIQGAFMMFLLPDVREMARKGQLVHSDAELVQKLIDLPMTMWEYLTILRENADEILETCIQDEDRAVMYRDAMEMKEFTGDLDNDEMKKALEPNKLLYFDDVNQEDDIVWGLAVNVLLKRITVGFRGSVTKKDFQQDAKALFSPIPNPVKKNAEEEENEAIKYPEISLDAELPEELKIHLGFREYMYGEEDTSWLKTKFAALSSSLKVDDAEEKQEHWKRQKYAGILEATSRVMKDYPDYHLYVTGHSLGGALATLFAFEAAAAPDDEIQKPVTCITTGSPKVGSLDFLRAFEKLEEEKRLRCLRVTNWRDVVTLSPPNGAFVPCFAICCQKKRFRHVGIRLKLYPDGHFLIAHPPKFYTCFGIMICDLLKIARHIVHLIIVCPLVCLFRNRYTYKLYRQEHTQVMYSDRFKACREDLEQLTLDGLYEERLARAKWRLPILHTSREMKRLTKKKT